MITIFRHSSKMALHQWKNNFLRSLISFVLIIAIGVVVYLSFAFLYVISLDCPKCPY